MEELELDYETEDDYDRLHRVEEPDQLAAALESLQVFVASIESNGMSKSDYHTLELIDGELFDSLPKVGYTATASKQNLTGTISAIIAKSKQFLKDLFIALMELIAKVVSFISEKINSFKKKPVDQAIAYGNQEIIKSQRAYIALLEKRIADLEKSQIPETLKDQKQQAIDAINNETNPTVMAAATEADKHYSTLVRSLYLNPDQLNTYFGFVTAVPMMANIAVSMLDNMDRLFILLRDVGNAEAAANAVVTLSTLSNSFRALLANSCEKHAIATGRLRQRYGRESLPHVHFDNRSDAVEFVRSTRDALLFAAAQPSGYNFKQEYPNDLSSVTAARVRIGDQLKVVDSIFESCTEAFSELLARSREVNQYIKEHNGIPCGKGEMDPEIKRELIATNRDLQKTITTILRLRNLSDVIRNSVQKQISYSIRRINAAGSELGKV